MLWKDPGIQEQILGVIFRKIYSCQVYKFEFFVKLMFRVRVRSPQSGRGKISFSSNPIFSGMFFLSRHKRMHLPTLSLKTNVHSKHWLEWNVTVCVYWYESVLVYVDVITCVTLRKVPPGSGSGYSSSFRTVNSFGMISQNFPLNISQALPVREFNLKYANSRDVNNCGYFTFKCKMGWQFSVVSSQVFQVIMPILKQGPCFFLCLNVSQIYIFHFLLLWLPLS